MLNECGGGKLTKNMDPNNYADDKYQLGLNTNVKMIFSKETIVTGVQIINKNYNKLPNTFPNKFQSTFPHKFPNKHAPSEPKQKNITCKLGR